MNFINSLLPFFEKFQLLGYWLVLILAFAESMPLIGLVIPGSLLLIFLGFLSGQGYFDIIDLGWFVLIGSLAGDLVSFQLGAKRVSWLKFSENNIQKGETFLKKHGQKSIVVARFIGHIRPVITLAAGFLKMDRKKFILWDLLSAICWVSLYLAVGYFFGQAWQLAAVWSTRLGLAIAILAVFIILLLFIKRLIISYGLPVFNFFRSIMKSIGQAIATNPQVVSLVKKYPRFFKFLHGRLEKKSFFGLPLTLLGLAFIYVVTVFGGLIEGVISSEQITSADLRVDHLFYAFRHPLMVKVFLFITVFGKSTIVIAGTIVLTLMLWLLAKHRQIAGLWLTMAGAAASAWLGKILLHRPRPLGGVVIEDSFSFPSGHATLSMAFYGYIIYLFWVSKRSWSQKINILFAGIFLISLVGFSRLYLGVHYFSDVAGGWLLGLLWLLIGISVTEVLIHANYVLRIPSAPKLKKPAIFAGLILIWILFFAFNAYYLKPPLQSPAPLAEVTLAGSDPLSLFNNDPSLSRYTEKLTGDRQEPISFIIAADSDQELLNTFAKAGWNQADQITPSTIAKIFSKGVFNEQYPNAPMTPSFWNADVHDFGFEKQTASQSVRQRHHARFWKTNAKTSGGKMIYVGTASLDVGIKWLVTHQIDPVIDTERELLFSDLDGTGNISTWHREQFVDPELGKNTSGDPFFTDGKTYIIELK